ncbi:MAG: LamG-like jellyroll fold domain-containing protein [Verrucomicrobiota bacterium]|nr:LamG-like jellyroll fold domain-containing protein [Verrucomicrobiota bacterium]
MQKIINVPGHGAPFNGTEPGAWSLASIDYDEGDSYRPYALPSTWHTNDSCVRTFDNPDNISFTLEEHVAAALKSGNTTGSQLFEYSGDSLPDCWATGWSITNYGAIVYPEFDANQQDPDSCCDTCEGGDCPPGKPQYSLGSVRINLPLGKDGSSKSAGALIIHETAPTSRLGTQECLLFRGDTSSLRTYGDATYPRRQYMTPLVFVDINNSTDPEHPNQWTVDFYNESSASWTGTNAYTPNPTKKYHSITFRWDSVNKRFYSDESGELGTHTRHYDESGELSTYSRYYEWQGTACTLVTTDSVYAQSPDYVVRAESIAEDRTVSLLTKTYTVAEGDGRVVSTRTEKYSNLPFGLELTELREPLYDSTGAPLLVERITTSDYYVASGEPGYGKLRSKTVSLVTNGTSTAVGAWDEYEYYPMDSSPSAGRLKTHTRQYLSSTPAGTMPNRITEYSYIQTALPGMGDAEAEQISMETEKIGSTIIARSMEISLSGSVSNALNPDGSSYDYTENWQIQCLDLSIDTAEAAVSSANAAKVLVTKTRNYASGTHKYKNRSVQQADGQISIQIYTEDGLSTTTYSGATNADTSAITKGRKEIASKNLQGVVVFREQRSMPDNYLLSYDNADDTDDFGRVLLGNTFDHSATPLPIPEVLHLTLDENQGQTAADTASDSTVNNGTRYEGTNPATSANGPAWATGHSGSGLRLDGSNDSLRVADADNLELTGSFTLALWVKLDASALNSSTAMRLMAKKNTASDNNGYEWYYQPSTKRLRFYGSGSSNYAQATLALALNDQWHHLLVAVSGTSVAFYLDGTALTVSDPSIDAPAANTQPLTIGRLGSGSYFKGTVDDVRIYNRLLSATDKQQLAGVYLGPSVSVAFTRQYNCCGLEYEIDRQGIRTDYSHDTLGRLRQETRSGLTRKITLDALGRTIEEKLEQGTETLTLSTTAYDTWGRVTARTEPYANTTRTHTFEYDSSDADYDLTTEKIDGIVQRIEKTYKDGASYEVTGPAVRGQRTAYSVAEGETAEVIAIGQNSPVTTLAFNAVVTQQTRLDTAGAPTQEWTKSYTDAAGRPYKTVLPTLLAHNDPGPAVDGAADRSYFNELGQLSKRMDPSGVVTLFTYSALGELYESAISLNGDNTIDYTGTDRIQRRETGTGTYQGMVVQWSKESLWETNGDNTPSLMRSTYTTPDGLESWMVTREGGAYAQTTHTVSAYNSSQKKLTQTTTLPDNTVQISVTEETSTERKVTQTVQHASLSPVILAQTTSRYPADAWQRLASTESLKDGSGNRTDYTYFNDGRLATVTTPDPDTAQSGTGQNRQTTSFTYAFDAALGETVTQTLPDATTQTTEYTPTGEERRKYGSQTYPTAMTYDYSGRMKTLTTWRDYTGQTGAAVTEWFYYNLGLLEQKKDAVSQGATYTYTPGGRLLTRTWQRGTFTTYGYTVAGEVETMNYSDSTPDVTNSYDRPGRLKTVTDAAGERNLSYENQLLKDVAYTGGAFTGWKVEYPQDSLLRRGGVKLWEGATNRMDVAYGYDSASRLQTISEGSLSQTYGYANYSGTVESQTFKRDTTTVLTTAQPRDSLGRLKTITHEATGFGSGFGYSLQYNDMNQITRRTETGGAYWQYGYDGLGQVTSAAKKTAADAIIPGYQYGFVFDDIGNRETTERNGRSATYTPNSRNQYTQRTVPGAVDALGEANASATVTVNGAASTRTGTLFFGTVTANNNQLPIWQPMDVVGTLAGAGTNGTDAISEENGFEFIPKTPEVFVHDTDGNLIEDGRWTYEWDAENRPIRMTTKPEAAAAGAPNQKLEYAYDSQGRRIRKEVSLWNSATSNYQPTTTSVFLYDSWNLLQELKTVHGTPNTTSTKRFVWGLDMSVSLQGAGGVGGLLWMNNVEDAEDASREGSYFTAFDHNGNLAALVNSTTGAIAASYEYGPFGETLRATGPMAAVCPFQFSTKYLDAETGLYYYGYRYYNPVTGQWVSRDPIGEQGGTNLFVITDNDTISFFDIDGLRKESSRIDYWNTWSKNNPNRDKGGFWKKKDRKRKKTLDRGCIGITCLNLGIPGNPSMANCYKRRAEAEARLLEMKNNCECSGNSANKKPAEPHLFSIHLWSDIGSNGVDPDISFDGTGKADLSNWDFSSRPAGDWKPGGRAGVNFDFGWVNESGTIQHANHMHYPDKPGNPMKVYESNETEWKTGNADFNAEVWCVDCNTDSF